MKITKMSPVQDARSERRQPAPAPKSQSRALVPVPVRGAAAMRRASARFSRTRRASAFLAHLALQYDGVSVRRQQRAERLDTAIGSYGAEAALRNARRVLPVRDLKI